MWWKIVASNLSYSNYPAVYLIHSPCGTVGQGAKVLCGGEQVRPSEPSLSGGYYISPCVMVGVADHMAIAREEVFGPVACVFPFDTEEEVIHRANDTEFGLAGGVFTKWVQKLHMVLSNMCLSHLTINRDLMNECRNK